MKNLKNLALASLAFLFFNCDNNDGTVQQQTGKWRLTNVSGGLTGVDNDFEGETITWEFNAGNNTVTIINNNTDTNMEDGPDSGNYTYGFSISESPEICPEVIKINNIDYGCVTLTQNTMVLNNTYADGFKYTFKYITNQSN